MRYCIYRFINEIADYGRSQGHRGSIYSVTQLVSLNYRYLLYRLFQELFFPRFSMASPSGWFLYVMKEPIRCFRRLLPCVEAPKKRSSCCGNATGSRPTDSFWRLFILRRFPRRLMTLFGKMYSFGLSSTKGQWKIFLPFFVLYQFLWVCLYMGM